MGGMGVPVLCGSCEFQREKEIIFAFAFIVVEAYM